MVKKKPQKTAQRAAIIEYLEDAKTHHPTITDIYDAVSKKLNIISMATVYNTMNLFKKQGIVRELTAEVGSGGVRFDPIISPHHHLICNVCKTFVDVDLKDIHHSMLLTEKQRKGFDVQKISITIYGICPHCKDNMGRMPAQN